MNEKPKRKIDESLEKLNNIYNKIPETTGCMKYIHKPEKEGGCGGKCCIYNNPSLLFIEFQNTWNWLLNNKTTDELADVVIRAVENFLNSNISKTCIFFDKENKICTQHESRPYACRMYSQVPEEEYEKRYVKLKVLYKDRVDAVIQPQCDRTKTVGSPPTTEQSDKWWQEIIDLEKSIGIPEKDITDEPNGTYRTYHDHILLNVIPQQKADDLNAIKLHGTEMEKKHALRIFAEQFKRDIAKKEKEIIEKRKRNIDKIYSINKQINELDQEIAKNKNGT